MIYIVIPVFNRLNFTKACIGAFIAQDYDQFKVIIVDHGSTDGTSEYIAAHFPEVMILKGDESMWWTGATNFGIQKALEISGSEHDFILTINNDVEVNSNYLNELLKIYQKNKPCLVGSITVDINNPDKVVYAGIKWNRLTAKYNRPPEIVNSHTQLISQTDTISTDLLTGRGALIPIMAFRKLGLYDVARFPHYMADEDFSLIAKKNGYQLCIATRAVVKSYVAETGLNFNVGDRSFSKLLASLRSIKSANNLHYRYLWAKKHSSNTAVYFSFDVVRIFGSYFRSLFR